jgi:outer membrane protein assembly factor BamB
MMKLNLTEKNIGLLRVTANIAAIFTMIVALTMIFSYIQLKLINPLDNPALLSIKEQYDKNQSDPTVAEQVRAMDLMARRVYFSSRWQVETGSYLLLAGAAIFFICQRLVTGAQKPNPSIPGSKPDETGARRTTGRSLVLAGSFIFISSLVISFILRSALPDPTGKSNPGEQKATATKAAGDRDESNYPFFRGYESRGIAGGKGYPVEWNGEEGKNIKWKTEIPKEGKSSPVIWGNRIFLTGSQDKDCEVYCLDKNTGQIIWTGKASGIEGEPGQLPQMDSENNLSTSTPAANDKVVCAMFANGNLVCFNHDGALLWSKNIGIPANTYGYSSSLLISGNLLLVQFDSDSKLSLFGFDIQSGEQKWETIRPGRPVWSSPVLANFAGKPQVVINGNPSVSSYDAVTGEELWSIECLSGDVAPSVAVNSTMAYAVTDYAKLAAIKGGSGASIIWEDNTYTPDVSSPVANDEYLFLSTGIGDVACYNSQKGDTLWTHYFPEPFYSSPIIADGKVFFLDRSGTMRIVEEGPKFKLLGECPLGERADCTPAFSDKKIYIRGKKNLYCISD